MDDRRELAFERIEDVMPEVERLLDGHSTTKGWTLGQIMHHLSTAIRLSLALDVVPPDDSLTPDSERVFKVRRRLFFRSGKFPEGLDVPHQALIPPVDADEQFEAESLRAALTLLESSNGPFGAHPMLGPLSRQEWLDFHRIHCAHHLGFATLMRPL